MSDAELLEDAALLLFGRNWEAVMAHVMEINQRTIQRWRSGAMAPPPTVWAELGKRLTEISEQYGAMAAKVTVAASEAEEEQQR